MRQFSLLFVATEQHFLPLVCAPTHPYAESDGRPLRSAPRDGVDAIRISLVRLSENATAEFLSSFFSALPPLPQSFLQHAHSQNSYSSSQVASSSRCLGREEGVIHDLAVRPSSASRLHDAQNCPACFRTVILPSLHDASSDTGAAAAPLLVSCGPGYTLQGHGWHARPVLLSSSLSGAPRLLCAPLTGLPVIRNNSPSPPPSSPGILVRRTVRWSPFHD